jgi:hypothetical protein
VTTKTFIVTVSNPGSGNKYYLDGVAAPSINFAQEGTYRFDDSDASVAGHPLAFSTTDDGTHNGGTYYNTGTTRYGTPGQPGAYVEIVVERGAPNPLYYFCQNHSGMGGSISVTSNSWGALEWGEGNWSGQGDNTVQLTGQELTLTLASITTDQTADIDVTGIQLTATNAGVVGGTSVDVTLTGIQSTYSIGQVVTGFGVNITGSSVSSSIGTVTIDEDLLTGEGWGRDTWGSLAWGVNYSVQVSGQELTLTGGEEDAGTDFVAEVTGQELTSTFGTFSIISDVGVTVFASEDQIDASVGSTSVTGHANVTITGNELTSSIGVVVPEPRLDVEVTGISATMTLGTFTLVQGTTESVTGQELTGSVGQVDAVSVAETSGIELTGSVGSVTVIGGAGIDVSGISATISVGSVTTQGWNEIDTGVNNIWGDVDLAA